MAPPMTRSSPCSLLSCAALFLSANAALASVPLVDFDRMGMVGITGAFSGLDISDNSSLTVTFDSSAATLLSRSADGSLSALGSTNPGGSILAGCALGDVYYFGGSFTSINGTSASNVASYSSSTDSFAALGSDGPNGEIHAMYCDSAQNTVWAGGKFTSPGVSVAVWEPKSSKWSSPAFGGLTGADAEVLSITTNSTGSSLFFAGSFTTTFGNGTAANTTNNPNVPYSAGATPFSSSLVPLPLQNAQIVAAPSSSDSEFDNINNVLCPAGPDGPGDTWFAADGNEAVITVRAFSLLNARGIRLGNTFLDGRGTTGFSVITIPDNTLRTLSYIDPSTGKNETCTDPCPLLTNSSILYQDFLFADNVDITGFQLTLSEWQGAGPGLHLLQLLSSGAFTSAVSSNNTESCFAPNASTVTTTGSWTEKEATTNIAATTETVLVSTVAVGTPYTESPSITYMPYVSASGEYDVYLVVPGCDDLQDCALRTSVQVTVFPGSGMDPSVTTVSQQNPQDQTTIVYSGPIVPSSPSFVTTITMTLAEHPIGDGQNGEYELVAAGVQLILTSANTASGGNSSINGTASGSASGFGFFEWPLDSKTSVNATGAMPNTTETALDRVGVDMLQALGGSTSLTSSTPVISAVAHHPSGIIFLGGQFDLTSGVASGSSNIVAFKNGALTALSDKGLNGAVTSLALDGDTLFVGGVFDDTSSTSTSGALKGVAMYDVQANKWSALGGGVNGNVASLDYSSGRLLVAGNFTGVLLSSSAVSEQSADGLAAWDVANSTWTNSGGFLVGNMTFVGNGTSSSEESQFVAGNVNSALEYGASGFVLVQNGADGEPDVTAVNAQFKDNTTQSTTISTSSKRRRSHAHHSGADWIPKINVFRRMFKRASTTTLTPLPAAPAATAPAILAGAFWTNSSSSQQVFIIGGNFSFTSTGSTYQNVAIYDNSTGSLKPLQGSQVNGTVRSLLVQGDILYIGGEFTLQGTNANGFAVYDLANQNWDMSGVSPLGPSSGSSVVVRSVTASPSQSDILIVAGSFAQAGSTDCRSICSYNMNSELWSALGNGIQGDVASVDYAGNNDDIIVAAGSIALADSMPANVAIFSIVNSTWAALGNGNDLPGPVTAVTVNDGNISSVFAAGRSTDNTTAFLYFWNGQTWSDVGSTLQPASDVSQLTMVPLQNTHTTNSIIQSDRVLMISGSLSDSSFGNASSALFDGESFIPYIVAATSSGSPGYIYGLIYSFSTFSFTQNHYLATGVVILISIAIAAGIVFLLALLGILWTLFSRRRDEKLNKFMPVDDEDDDSTRRPSSLLEHINAATRTTIIGEPGPYYSQAEKEPETAGVAAASAEHDDPFGPDGSNYVRAETPSEAIAGTMGEESGRPAFVRYAFEGTGEGEIPLIAGQEVEVLDDNDPSYA
ncbi:hypothetical protein WOLCODRAFT_153770 [Wolfiporia cocos MD-104 SS10]|uniref:SH3 domain-containing protein n=1 Tax=Wolfiporia cocos (strain MD-104) TaxID=742152 RepID=A0A2H3JP97_WOLCO|nr:hypothetical protein WOLCODRAFT_153770 [Wolfiporia cocos MD-104 SS10]